MRRKLLSIVVIVILLTILHSGTIVKGYTPQFNGFDIVNQTTDAVSFTMVPYSYTVKLANVDAKNLNDRGGLNALLPNGTAVYLDIFNQTMNKDKLTLTCVVYIVNKTDSNYYVNVNKALLEQQGNYFFTFNPADNVTPYTWTVSVPKDRLTNNTQGIDLSTFEDARNSLVSNYNNQTLAHAGYLLAFLAVLVTLISQMDIVYRHLKKWTYLFIGGIAGLVVYSFYRLIYWSWIGNQILVVTPDQALSTGQLTIVGGIQSYVLEVFSTQHTLRGLYQFEGEYPFAVLLAFTLTAAILTLIISLIIGYFMKGSFRLKLSALLILTVVGFCSSFFISIMLPPIFLFIYGVGFVHLINAENKRTT